MIIKSFNVYRDGGTIEITTEDDKVFCFDDRILSKTKGKLYDGYPKENNSNIITENAEAIEIELIKALSSYKNEYYQDTINAFIESK